MDFTVTHSFPETRTSRVLPSSFDHVPRQPGGLFWQTNHTGWNMGASLWPGDKSSIQAMEAFWLATSKEGTGPAISGQNHADSILGSARSSYDGFLGNGYHNYWKILCLTSEQIAKIYQNREAWNADQWGTTPAGQCSSSQRACCPDRSSVQRLWNPSSPSLLSRPGTVWLPPLSIHEGKAIKKRWKPHFRNQGMASGTTCWVLQKRSPKLHKAMGEVCLPCRSLCRERLIFVPRFNSLESLEVGQGKSLMNAPRTHNLCHLAVFFPEIGSSLSVFVFGLLVQAGSSY